MTRARPLPAAVRYLRDGAPERPAAEPDAGEIARWTGARWFADGSLPQWLDLQGLDETAFRSAVGSPLARVLDPGDVGDAFPALAVPSTVVEDSLPLTLVRPLVERALLDVDDILVGARDDGLATAATASTVRDTVAGDLLARLALIANRTVVLELTAARDRGELTVADGSLRGFGARLRDPGFRADLLADHPVLARLCTEEAGRTTHAVGLLFRHLAEAVRDGTLPREPVVAVSEGRGDTHRGGLAVRAVTFAGGRRIAYKPRSLAPERAFATVVEEITGWSGGPDLYLPAGHDRGRWGWQDWVDEQPVSDPGEFDAFYERFGVLLGIAHAVLLTDLHFENVIAHGSYPVPIDLETLAQPAFHHVDAELDTPSLGRPTVLTTGLLPHLSTDGHFPFGISGLTGGAPPGTRLPASGELVLSGSGEIRAEEIEALAPTGRNVPSAGGVRADPTAHRPALERGLRNCLEAARSLFADPGRADAVLRRAMDGVTVRVVPRATRTYAQALYESTHPALLADGLERELYLSHLWRNARRMPRLQAVVRREHDDLLDGDVPVFDAPAHERDLLDSRGRRIPDVLPSSPCEELWAHRERVLAEDPEVQCWVAEVSIAGAAAQPVSDRFRTTPVSGPDTLGVVATLVSAVRAMCLDTPTGPQWLTAEVYDDGRYAPTPAGDGLYDGRAGIGLFLTVAGVVLGDRSAADLAAATLTHVADAPAPAEPGWARGGAGVAWCLAHAGTLLGLPQLTARARASAPAVAGGLDGCGSDVVSGHAGVALAAASLSARLPGAGWDGVAVDAASRLVRDAVVDGDRSSWPTAEHPGGSSGFGHGAAGIGAALARTSGLAGTPRATAIRARQALAWEESVVDANGGTAGWCRGAPGVALGFGVVDPAGLRAAIARGTVSIPDGVGRGPHGLCHGSVGSVAILRELTTLAGLPDTDLVAAEDALLDDLLCRGADGGAVGGARTAALMNGVSGIGYGLARRLRPDVVPDVLAPGPDR